MQSNCFEIKNVQGHMQHLKGKFSENVEWFPAIKVRIDKFSVSVQVNSCVSEGRSDNKLGE